MLLSLLSHQLRLAAFFAAGLTKSIGDGYGSFYRGGIEIGIGRNGFFILAFDTP